MSGTPNVHLIHIFSYLPVDALCCVASSCKKWNYIQEKVWNFDISKHIPSLRIYGEAEWYAHYRWKVASLPPLSKRQCIALYRINKEPQIKKEGGSLITIPAGMALNRLLPFNRSAYMYSCCELVKEECGDVRSGKIRRVFISRGSFEDTSQMKKWGCEEGELNCVIAHIMLTYQSTAASGAAECLYDKKYIACKEVVAKYRPLIGAWFDDKISIQDTGCLRTIQHCSVAQLEC